MSAHILLNLLNELRNEFDKFNNTGARILDSIYHMTVKLLKIAFLTQLKMIILRDVTIYVNH